MNDIDIFAQRRIDNIISPLLWAQNISSWLSTLGSEGQWPASEIDYTVGCTARRANWPAQNHWQRIIVMAAAWHGGMVGGDQYVKSASLRSAISLAMNYWFSNDFTDATCLDSGGLSGCPCGTPGFWNTNWFSNIILIPNLVGQTCLLLNDTLSVSELASCGNMTLRAFGTFDRIVNGLGYLTGANTLDVAKIGLDHGLLVQNVTLIVDALGRVHNEVVVQQQTTADGIRPDGSFGQHGGMIYNGNYGKDYANDDLDIETEAGGTQFEADATSKAALATLIDGDQWMIYRNVISGVLHWDFSVLGRFISFPVADDQATWSIKINITEIHQLGEEWDSGTLTEIADSLSRNTTNANIGTLMGNRMFYANDYMVQRGPGYVTTLKMYSTRTRNSECTNSQNPLGFHLSDGTVYTYMYGNEYEDIAAAWDWNLIPGITTDYAATPLNCVNTSWAGIQAFVGGVSDGEVGVAAMHYTNPYTQTLSWKKTWFFLENDVQHVMISILSSTTTAPLYSILDQRLHTGDVVVNDTSITQSSNFTSANTLWHGGVGYSFDESSGISGLSVEVGVKSGNWSVIGISTQPNATVDLFAAYISHSSSLSPISYTAFPATESSDAFKQKSAATKLRTIQNDAHISALYDDVHSTAMIVFWDSTGGSVIIPGSSFTDAPLTITSNGNSAVIYQLKSGNVTVSDPSQTLTNLNIKILVGLGKKPPHWGWEFLHDFSFDLPSSGSAGSSVSQNISSS
jgi:hypothetical protein